MRISSVTGSVKGLPYQPQAEAGLHLISLATHKGESVEGRFGRFLDRVNIIKNKAAINSFKNKKEALNDLYFLCQEPFHQSQYFFQFNFVGGDYTKFLKKFWKERAKLVLEIEKGISGK